MHRVLLVLDSEELSAVLHKELSSDFEVNVCDTATALDMIEHYRPDALILDLFLTGTDGFSILQGVYHQIPVTILLTVLSSNSILRRSNELGVDCIFLKPFKISALTSRLKNLLLERA